MKFYQIEKKRSRYFRNKSEKIVCLCFDFFKNLYGVNQTIKKGSGNIPCGNLDGMVGRPLEQISDLSGHGQCWLRYYRLCDKHSYMEFFITLNVDKMVVIYVNY